MIKAGTVWEKFWHKAECCKDMRIGDPITWSSVLLDGQHREPGSPLPFWFVEMIKDYGAAKVDPVHNGGKIDHQAHTKGKHRDILGQ